MENNNKDKMLLVAIVAKDMGKKVEEICGRTLILEGRGTANKEMLAMLGIEKIERDVAVCMVDKADAQMLLLKLNEEFAFYAPGNGIAFTLTADTAGILKKYFE